MGIRIWAWALFLLAGTAHGGVAEHARGEYRFATGPVPAFVERAALPAQWPEDAPGADDARWRYWLHDVQSDRRSGHDEVFVDYAYEARGTSLIGDAGRFEVSFNPEYQRLTFHEVGLRRDGHWHDRLAPERISLARREDGFERDLADGTVSALIVLDDVRPRDVVRIAYSIAGSNPVLAGQGSDWLRFGWQHPMLHARLRVLMDPGSRPRVHRERGAPEAVVRDRADAVETVIEGRALPLVVDDGQYPAWYQPYPRAQVSGARSWADVVAWAMPLYPPVERLPEDLEQKLAQWRQLPDRRARITAALRLVQDEVRYFGVEMGENTHRPTPPADTWRRRYGDCKDKVYLLVSLLGRMDVDAVPALVSASRGKAVSGFAPSAAVFDHVIARVEVPGETLWLDPTITMQGGRAGDYDLSDYGVALPVMEGSAVPEAIAAPPGAAERNGVVVVERYLPQADARDVQLEIETIYRGDSADGRRRSLASERGDELSRRYADYYRRRLGDLDATAAPRIDDDREANALTVTESYLLKAPFDDEAGAVKALDVYADALQDVTRLPASMARTTPLAYAVPGRYRHEIRVAVPERWSAVFGKENREVSGAVFDYARDVTVDGEEASVVYRLDVRQAEVAGEDASDHLARIRELQDELSATLRFRMPANVAADERQRRLQQLLRNAIDEGAAQ
jgi:transglutaminase-like putative cysteine protease